MVCNLMRKAIVWCQHQCHSSLRSGVVEVDDEICVGLGAPLWSKELVQFARSLVLDRIVVLHILQYHT